MATEQVFPAAAPVSIGRGLIASSFQYVLTGDEHLRVTVVSVTNGGPVDVVLRLWRDADRRVVTSSGTVVTTDPAPSTTTKLFPLSAGALLNLRVSLDTAPRAFPLVWVRAQLVRGFEGAVAVIGTLLQGYLGSNRDLAWPGSAIESGDNVSGLVLTLPGGIGAASSTITVPTSQRWRIVSGRMSFTASGVVATRTPLIAVLDSTAQIVFAGIAGVAVTAGNTGTYSFGAAQSPSTAGGAGQFHLAFPADVELSAGCQLLATVDSPQVGDAFGSFLVQYRLRVDV